MICRWPKLLPYITFFIQMQMHLSEITPTLQLVCVHACCAASALLDITKHRLVCGLFFEVRNAGRGRAMHAASDMFTYILLICADF